MTLPLGDELLQGEKVRLAMPQRSDLPEFAEWFERDTELMRYLNIGEFYPNTLADEEAWFAAIRNREDEFVYTIRALEDDRILGNCSLRIIEWASGNSEVGIFIGPPEYRGRGYGSDAMQILLRFAFLECNLHRVGLSVYGYNHRAIASYQKVGFQQEAVPREALLRDGQYYDFIRMGILYEEWAARYWNP